jgi:hypothetical protein
MIITKKLNDFYKISNTFLEKYIDIILTIFNESFNTTIYDNKEWEIILSNKIKYFKTVKSLGITQNISVWNQIDDI